MNFFAEFLGLSLILGACKSTESLNSVRVVEQSRKERPAWVGLPIGLTDSTASLVLSHIVKARVIDLPLGLRQAEVSALSDSRLL